MTLPTWPLVPPPLASSIWLTYLPRNRRLGGLSAGTSLIDVIDLYKNHFSANIYKLLSDSIYELQLVFFCSYVLSIGNIVARRP